MLFTKVSAQRETQTTSSRIRTRVANFISYDNNHYDVCASLILKFRQEHLELINFTVTIHLVGFVSYNLKLVVLKDLKNNKPMFNPLSPKLPKQTLPFAVWAWSPLS